MYCRCIIVSFLKVTHERKAVVFIFSIALLILKPTNHVIISYQQRIFFKFIMSPCIFFRRSHIYLNFSGFSRGLFFITLLAAALIGNVERLSPLFHNLKDIRCVLRNNYILMEISRPVSECTMCQDVNGPIILYNPWINLANAAYTSTPILLKGAASMSTFLAIWCV